MFFDALSTCLSHIVALVRIFQQLGNIFRQSGDVSFLAKQRSHVFLDGLDETAAAKTDDRRLQGLRLEKYRQTAAESMQFRSTGE